MFFLISSFLTGPGNRYISFYGELKIILIRTFINYWMLLSYYFQYLLSSNLFSHITFYVRSAYVRTSTYVVVLLIALSQIAKTSVTSNNISVSGNKRSVHTRWSSGRRINKKISSRREEKKEMSSSFSRFGASVAARGCGSSWTSSFERTEGVWRSAPLIFKI